MFILYSLSCKFIISNSQIYIFNRCIADITS
nr:MAG TPA: hypothetical protein [Caudoviricetes sp.]